MKKKLINMITSTDYSNVELGFIIASQNNLIDEILQELFPVVFVEGGTFNREGRLITVSSFEIGVTPVTQLQYWIVTGERPSHFKGDNLPVETVSWEDCVNFCKKLSNLAGETYRLPTEAEWEYAARGGKKSKGYKYAGSNSIGDYAWYRNNSNSQTHEVGTRKANELGLYDMSGNVWEWCSDWKGDYEDKDQRDPIGAGTGSYRVLRGGSWYSNGESCRVQYRYFYSPLYEGNNNGFRLVRPTVK